MVKTRSINLYKGGVLIKMATDTGSLNLKNSLAARLMYAG